jgi:putative oxygen-independent coproporphyrinogen III oxidase
MPDQPPLSLYVHLPWCVRKCPYCDFNSYSGGDATARNRYLEALLADLRMEAGLASGREIISIFLGGGTPSLFTPGEIGRVLDEIAGLFPVTADVEITMEANPGTIECGDPGGYRRAGVNRLSIGAQTFDASALAALGRIHGAADIGRAASEARDAGFDNVNLDLMYALPDQDVAAAMSDIEAAARLEPQHISWYHLTLEPNTVFYSRPPAGLPDDDRSFEIQQEGEAMLAGLGYARYEVSAFAREGRHCRHNLNYWSFGDYLAVGAGAHGKVSTSEGVFRYVKPANPQQYMKSMESGEETRRTAIGDDDLMFEFMLNALRLVGGFDETDFNARTGLPARKLRRRLEPLVGRGLIEQAGARTWRPTSTGRHFLNDLQAHFLPD